MGAIGPACRRGAITIAVVSSALAAAAPVGAQTGGSFAAPAPAISSVICSAKCSVGSAAQPGSRVRVTGRNLRRVALVVFLGGRGRADDVAVKPRRATAGAVEVEVPARAKSGRVVVLNRDGQSSGKSRRLIVEAAPAALRRSGGLVSVQAVTRKAFFGAEQPATLSYVVNGSQPLRVAVELVRANDAASIMRWDLGVISPGQPAAVAWDGRAGGRVQREGRYEFRVYAARADAAAAAQAAQPVAGDSFVFLRHIFPVRGRHDYGEEGAKFGAGRGGRAHQGHDVMAACGTPLVAARGGTVQFEGSHARAGNYLVIDGDDTDVDYAYMHLREKALVTKGARVFTGQLLGEVGDTGSASACHLHFEMWSGPGWYEGGSPFDPFPSLQAWDAQS